MTVQDRRIEVAAEAAYNTHWGVMPTGKYPPCWVDLRQEVKEFIRAQIRSAFNAADRFDTNKSSDDAR